MFLVQILVPLYDNDGRPFAGGVFKEMHEELAALYGGLTAFTQSPAEGFWQSGAGTRTDSEAMILVEVMTEALDEAWWARYRRQLEQRFRQDEVVIRALEIRRL